MSRYTKIICTLGPASGNEKILVKMAKRGMNIVRLNFSHGDYAQHQKMIDLISKVNKKHGYDIKVLQDLEGYRIRIGRLKRNVKLEVGKSVFMSNQEGLGENVIPFDYTEDLKNIKKGAHIYIDDGTLDLKVLSNTTGKLKLKVIQGGTLKSRKGVNIPGLKMQANITTEKDLRDIEFGIKNNVDKIAISFVRNKKDVTRISDIVRKRIPECMILAKIECEEGLKNIDNILDVCDGIIVARGDLGVTMPIYKMPMIQKYLIAHCNRRKKLSVTATQMLDSMIENGRPTRAEVTDVANAILDGSDYVMLSGETAIGKYPSRSIMTMHQIVEYTEKSTLQLPK